MVLSIALAIALALIAWRLLPHLALVIVVATVITAARPYLPEGAAIFALLAIVGLWGFLFVLSIRRLLRLAFERLPHLAALVNPAGGNFTAPGYAAALMLALSVALVAALGFVAIVVMAGLALDIS